MNIKHDLYSNCAQDVFLNILDYYKLNSNYLLSSGWSFHYTPNDQSAIFGDAVNIYKNDFSELEMALKDVYGIELSWIPIVSPVASFKMLKKHINNFEPICIYIDSYYCNWQSGYNIYHNMHLIILLDICNDYLLCADPYINKAHVYLSFRDFIDGTKFLISLKKVSQNIKISDNMILCRSINNQFFKDESDKNTFEQMRAFAYDLIPHKKILDEEFKEDNIAFISIIRKTTYISYGRMSFLEFLMFMENKHPTSKMLSKYIGSFNEIARMWSIISNKFIKYKLSGLQFKVLSIISDDILHVAILEEEIANALKFDHKELKELIHG